MAKNKIPPIPKAQFKDSGQQRTADAITNAVDVLAGRKGNGLDRAVLVSDLKGLNLASLKRNENGSLKVSAVVPPQIKLPKPDLVEKPTVPTGVKADGVFSSIIITWDEPQFEGYSHTEVYRSNTNDISKSMLRDTPSFHIWADAVDYDSTYYYWLRHVNLDGDKSAPHAGARAGLVGKSAPNINGIIKDLSGKISQGMLAQALQKPLNDAKKLPSVFATLPKLWTANVGGTDARGKKFIGGFGVVADPKQGTVEAGFDVDKFWVGKTGVSGKKPFIISGGKVYIDNAFIDTAHITSLFTDKIVVDRLKGKKITSVTVESGDFIGGHIGIGGTSTNRKFEVDNTGRVTAKNIDISGQFNIRSSGSGSRLQIVNDRLEVWDNGKLRVRLGRLS